MAALANSYTGAYDTKTGLTRTNPFAEGSNLMKLYGVLRQVGYFGTSLSVSLVASTGVLTIDLTAGDNPAPLYVKYVVRDQSGNRVLASLDTTNATTSGTPLAINASALKDADTWTLQVFAEQKAADGGDKVDYEVKLPSAQANYTVLYAF